MVVELEIRPFEKPPHRVVSDVLNSIAKLPQSVSESISSQLDKLPFGEAGPHRIVDSVVKGVGDALTSIGEGVAKALDTPLKVVKRG